MATLANEGSVFQAKQNQQQASYFAPFLPNRYVFIFISIERRKLSILQKIISWQIISFDQLIGLRWKPKMQLFKRKIRQKHQVFVKCHIRRLYFPDLTLASGHFKTWPIIFQLPHARCRSNSLLATDRDELHNDRILVYFFSTQKKLNWSSLSTHTC